MAAIFRFYELVLRESPVFIRGLRRCSVSSKDATVSAEQDAKQPGNREAVTPLKKHEARFQNRINRKEEMVAPPEYRYIYPEFLPDKDPSMRHRIRERLEIGDMLSRRKVIDIPEFYVGSILAVTATDRYAPGKKNRFVGICIHRSGYGLRAVFILRNVVDHQGVEIMYELYNPCIREIEVLKLEKRLDDELFYLRDALPEYSTFSFDMLPTLHVEGAPVPVNPIKVKLKPLPWHERWERKNLKGVEELDLEEKYFEKARKLATPWEKYDLMKEYRRLIPEEEQREIYAEVYKHEKERSKTKQPKRKLKVT